MSIDDRLALLEKKLRFTRLTLTALLLGLAVVCAVGAGDHSPTSYVARCASKARMVRPWLS